jgi:putative DNA primase/helicase
MENTMAISSRPITTPKAIADLSRDELLAAWQIAKLPERLEDIEPVARFGYLISGVYEIIQHWAALYESDMEGFGKYVDLRKTINSLIFADDIIAIDNHVAAAVELLRTARRRIDRRSKVRNGSVAALPEITVRAGALAEICDDMEENFIAGNWPIYQRGNKLVTTKPVETVTYHGKEYTTNIVPISADGLSEMASRAMLWKRMLKTKDEAGKPECKYVDPPKVYANTYIAQDRSWRVHQINGIFPTPTFRPDGSLLNEPGYDFATKHYLVNDPTIGKVEVESKPSKDAAIKMKGVLLEYLTEFQFIDKGAPGGGAISKAVALSMIISLVTRGILGQVPMHSVVAPTPGSGKSYLVDIASFITLGIPCPVISLGKSEEEYVKVLTSHVVSGAPLICNDNVNDELGSDLLGQIIERPLVSVRPFGRNDTILQIAYRGLVFANGNNMMVRGDMVRRAIFAFLDTKAERPELIRYKRNPKAMIAQDRAKPIIAALTMVRAYIEAGTPGVLPVLNSFAEWSNLVRSMLVWFGEADVCESMEAARDADPVLGSIRDVMGEFEKHFGLNYAFTLRDLVAVLEFGEGRLYKALLAVSRIKGGKLDSESLGKWFRSIKDRPVDGRVFKQLKIRQKVAIWGYCKIMDSTIEWSLIEPEPTGQYVGNGADEYHAEKQIVRPKVQEI